MRITALALTILGGLAAALLGAVWLIDAAAAREAVEALRALGADTSELNRLVLAGYLLLGAFAASIASFVLILKRKGKIASGLLLLAVIAPAIASPKTLIATFLLVLAAVFAFLVAPKKAPPVAHAARPLGSPAPTY